MIIYFIIFFASVFLYLFNDVNRKNGVTSVQMPILIIFMLFLACFVGFGDMLGGYDRYIYAELFDDVANTLSRGMNIHMAYIFQQWPKETAYIWINIAIAHITENRYIFIMIYTMILYVFIFDSIRKYCSDYPFAIMLFLSLWFFFTFTYLRQVMGAAIGWMCVRFIINRQPIPFLICWYIAFRCHNSAVVLLPMYFVPIRKYSVNQIVIVMVLCFLFGISGLGTAIFNAYGEADPERKNNPATETGFRLPYLLEAVFFLYIILSRYIEIPNEKKYIVLLNMALVFCAILLFFIKSENGGRMSWYFMIGVISTVTFVCTHTPNNRQYAYVLIVVGFFLFQRIVFAWGVLLYPYKTFFSNGFREGDKIHEEYEYDRKYDDEKMYRSPIHFQ